MKNKKLNLLLLITIYVLIVINIVRKFSYSLIGLSIIISIVLLFLYKYNKKNKYFNSMIMLVSVISLIISICFKSFNGIGILIFYIFLLIISLSIMLKKDYPFEISLPVSASILILLFIAFGFINLLKYSSAIMIIISVFCLYYLFKNKEKLETKINDINKFSYIIFSLLFLIAIIGGIGRYVHKWDEYSYWGYSAKVLIDTGSFSKYLSYVGTMNTYPPVSSIWHYIISVFTGYSEQNLYIGLTILDFIFLIPVLLKIEKNKIILGILLILASFGFPLLLNGSITYSLLYVDLLLGMIAASVLIIEDYLRKNNKSTKVIFIFLILITLLKPNGFVFSSCMLFLFYLKDLMINKITLKSIFRKMKKYILPVIIIVIIYIIWSFISTHLYNSDNSYIFQLIPKDLSTDISLKLNFNFIMSYANSLVTSIDDTIIYSFIPISLFLFLIVVFIILHKINLKEDKQSLIKFLLPYAIFYVTFYLLTALSLFIMFTYYEASILASFSRYLNPIHMALVLFIFYKISYLFSDEKFAKIFYIIIIVLVGFGNLTYFVTDIKSRRDEMHTSYERQDKFKIINEKTPKNSKIFIINQEDEESIMPMWYARYYCYPRIVNANPGAITWKIRTKSNTWDLKKWGLNKERFIEHIKEYKFDYVYFYTITDELIEELSDVFENFDGEKQNKLYKVDFNQNKLKLVVVEE